MIVGVAGQSFVGSRSVIAAATEFTALGPLIIRGVLVEVRVEVSIAAAGVCTVGAVLSNSSEETEANFRSGDTLVARSEASSGRIPVLRLDSQAADTLVFIIPVGLVLDRSNRRVIVSVAGGAAALTYWASVSMVRLLEVSVSAATETLRS